MKTASTTNCPRPFNCGQIALFLTFMLIQGAANSQVARSGEVELQQAVTGFANYLRGIRSASFKSVFKDKFVTSEKYTNSLAQEWIIDFEGRRLWRRTQKSPVDGTVPDNLCLSEQLMSPTRLDEVSLQSESGDAETMMGYLNVPQDYWTAETGFLYLSFPFGYLQDDSLKFIPELLVNPSLKTQGDSVVLSGGVAGAYRITVELSPSKNWMPLRVDFVRPETRGKHELVGSSYVVDESQQIDGIWFPVAYRCTTAVSAGLQQLPPGVRVENGVHSMQVDEDGNPCGIFFTEQEAASIAAEVAVSDVKFNQATDDDFQLKAKVPNGTTVWLQDVHNVDYVWRDGQAVPRSADSRRAIDERR